MTMLAVENLDAFYGDFQALFGVGASVNEGETVAAASAGSETEASTTLEPPPMAAPPLPPPSVDPVSVPPSAPERDTVAAPAQRRFPWVAVVLGLLAVAAIAVLLVMLLSTSRDKDDAEEAPAATQSELAEAEAELEDAETALSESEAALAQAESDLADSEAALVESEAALSDAEAARGEAEAAQTEAEAARDEQQQRADEYEEAAVNFLALSFGQGLGLEGNDAQCVGQGLVDSMGADALAMLASAADESTPGSEVAEFGVELLRVAEDCGIDPDTVDSPLGSDAFAYGDDPELDAMYDACAAGDSVACDDLYINSPAGSDYEQFGGTCGGRFEYSDSELCEGRF